MITSKQIQIIHILKNKYELADNTYRNFMNKLYGVDTCKLLNECQAQDFIHQLNFKFNDDYRLGYNEGVKVAETFVSVEDMFSGLVQKLYGHAPTKTELAMFRMGNNDFKKSVIDELKKELTKID